MKTTLLIFVFALVALCILLMRRILKLEYSNFDLNEKLNISDQEYISLFDENTKLSDKLLEVKLMNEIKKITNEN
jgi:hypothetical protein